MHGEGFWDPDLIAPSLESFRNCLEVFRRFAHGRSCPAEVEANPPSKQEKSQFLRDIKRLTDDDSEAWGFWAVRIDLDPEECEG